MLRPTAAALGSALSATRPALRRFSSAAGVRRLVSSRGTDRADLAADQRVVCAAQLKKTPLYDFHVARGGKVRLRTAGGGCAAGEA
jgi:hypothetical protein